MSTALVGVEFLFTDQQTVYGNVPPLFTQLGRGELFNLNIQIWLAALVTLLMYGLMEQTELGRYFYALGGNHEAARLSGIRVRAVRLAGFLISGVAGALTGVLIVAQSASSSPTAGSPYLLPALTAAFLGTSMFRQGQFNVFGTIIGVLFLGVIQTGLIMLHLSTAIINIVQGVILVAAILLSRSGARP
jgi:ribose transport system permease protein